eukprot:CAMPEP_0113844748 /NCGR_PEP_ID=MMETSP0372-20130328/396_1 /TAXON_ID=340204 /ORGANISM="Lankesteria abbotti" /LENGTH=453 /DNA_ID=CAMNT_0000813759 /DNA_START=127 /DNA_END=1488 /DNA_ORIENTATION=- /assembly_acc=CAM_ASM_000359
MKALMRDANVQANAPDQELALVSITNAGFVTSIMGAIIAGAFCDLLGPKITAMAGQLLFALGYVLIFFVNPDNLTVQLIGASSMGLAHSAIFNSHTSCASLFPANATLVLAILGSGPDVSLAIPVVLFKIGASIGVHKAIAYYLCVVAGVFVLEFFLVPMKVFSPPEDVKDDDSSPSSVPRRSAGGFTRLTLAGQLATPHFWVFTVFTGLNMFRKLHYTQLVKPIMESIATTTGNDAGVYVSGFKNAMPLAMIPALLMGVFTNWKGVVAGLYLENLWGVLLYGCCSFAVMPLQWASILFFNFMSSYVFGILYAFLATYYGMKTLGTLQGIQMFVAGLASHGFTYWNQYFVMTLPSILTSNLLLFGVSIAMFGVPLFLQFFPPRTAKAEEDQHKPLMQHAAAAVVIDTEDDRRASSACMTSGGGYGKSTVSIVDRDVDIRARKHLAPQPGKDVV